jgi:hypothetical protein
MNFKKEIIVQFRKILAPFRSTKDCHSRRSLTVYWSGRFVPSTGILTWTAVWGHYVSSFHGPGTKYFLVNAGGLSLKPGCDVYYFFMMISLGAQVQIWFS